MAYLLHLQHDGVLVIVAKGAALSVKVGLDMKDAYFVSPAFVGSSTARDQVGEVVKKALGMTGADIAGQVRNALQDAVDECEYQE